MFMDANYYLYIDQQYGPYDATNLASFFQEGRLNKDSWIFFEGETADWTRAEEVVSLRFLFEKKPTSPSSPPPKTGLTSLLKQAAAQNSNLQKQKTEAPLGTVLVPPTAASSVRVLEHALPFAPLSDLIKKNTANLAHISPDLKKGWLHQFKNLFRVKK